MHRYTLLFAIITCCLASLILPSSAASDGFYVISSPSVLQNVITVAQSGGDFPSVQAALDSIGDAGSGNPYLIIVGPGVFTSRVNMKPHVSIQGSGRGITVLEAPGENGQGTVNGAGNAELRDMTVRVNGGSGGTAVRNYGTSPRLERLDVTLMNTSGVLTGVYNYNSGAFLKDVKIDIYKTGLNALYGIHCAGSAANYPQMEDCRVSVGGPLTAYGLLVETSHPKAVNCTFEATSGGGVNGARMTSCMGTFTNCTFLAGSGSIESYGVRTIQSNALFQGCYLSGINGSLYVDNFYARLLGSILNMAATGGGVANLACSGCVGINLNAWSPTCQ